MPQGLHELYDSNVFAGHRQEDDLNDPAGLVALTGHALQPVELLHQPVEPSHQESKYVFTGHVQPCEFEPGGAVPPRPQAMQPFEVRNVFAAQEQDV